MSRGQVYPFAEARRLKATNPKARWASVAADFAGEVWPQIQPSYRIQRGETVFTIGSCFARNIERHLHALGCKVPMMDLSLPADEWTGEPNGAMNKFHPPSFRQSLEWAAAIFDRDGKVVWGDCEALAFDVGSGKLFDLDLACTAVPRDRFIERRQHIYDIVSTVFTADCLMMTPGLIEAWRDRRTGLYIHEAPTQKAMLAATDRWEMEILPYETCLTDLLAAIDVVRARNPQVKVLVTTSPVPMSATFSGKDVRIANSYSKSVLRAVCGAASAERPLVDYFPSYECATLSFPMGVWKSDRIHISSGFVGKIVAHMLDHYLEGVEDAARQLQQARTLFLSKSFEDAEEAVRAALAVRPEHTEARALLADILIRLNRGAEAEAELTALLADHADRSDLWILLARAAMLGGAPRAAEVIDHVQAAVALQSVTLSDVRAVAQFLRAHAPPAKTEAIMRKAVELYPLRGEAHQMLADALLDQGRRADAIDSLKQAVEQRRMGADVLIQLATLLIQDGRPAEAAPALKRALAFEPANAQAQALLAGVEGTGPLPAPSSAPAPAATARRPSIWSAIIGRHRP